MPSTFSHELELLACKSLLAQRLVVFIHLPFAIDVYYNESKAFLFAQLNFDVYIGFIAGF